MFWLDKGCFNSICILGHQIDLEFHLFAFGLTFYLQSPWLISTDKSFLGDLTTLLSKQLLPCLLHDSIYFRFKNRNTKYSIFFIVCSAAWVWMLGLLFCLLVRANFIYIFFCGMIGRENFLSRRFSLWSRRSKPLVEELVLIFLLVFKPLIPIFDRTQIFFWQRPSQTLSQIIAFTIFVVIYIPCSILLSPVNILAVACAVFLSFFFLLCILLWNLWFLVKIFHSRP